MPAGAAFGGNGPRQDVQVLPRRRDDSVDEVSDWHRSSHLSPATRRHIKNNTNPLVKKNAKFGLKLLRGAGTTHIAPGVPNQIQHAQGRSSSSAKLPRTHTHSALTLAGLRRCRFE